MTSENVAVVRAMLGQGWSAEEIAETLRVDAAEVAALAAEPARAPAEPRARRLSAGAQALACTRALGRMMRTDRPVGSPPPRGETIPQEGSVYGRR